MCPLIFEPQLNLPSRFIFWDRISMCTSGCPGTHRDPLASAICIRGLKATHPAGRHRFLTKLLVLEWQGESTNSKCGDQWNWLYWLQQCQEQVRSLRIYDSIDTLKKCPLVHFMLWPQIYVLKLLFSVYWYWVSFWRGGCENGAL